MANVKWDIKKVEGILNYVYWLGKPAVVRSSEIETIRKFLQEFRDVEVIDQQMAVNSKVLIKQGVLITATPRAPFTDPDCGNLSISSLGVKGATGTRGAAVCWDVAVSSGTVAASIAYTTCCSGPSS